MAVNEYGTRGGVELIFGVSNITKWADADNDRDATKIDNRVAWALRTARDRINNAFRQSIYKLPFADIAADPATPETIQNICETLAGVILYMSPRGLADGSDQNDQIQSIKDDCEERITKIISGREKIDAAQDCQPAPVAVPQG